MRLSWRVFLANAAVLTAATLVLAISPATVSFPIGAVEAVVLGSGLLLMLAADLVVLRRAFAPFERLVAFMGAVDPLRPGRRVPIDTRDPDVREATKAFNDMLERVEVERRESALRLLEAQESERRRVSRELHDEIGQLLTAALLQLDDAIDDLAPADAAKVEPGRELVDRSLAEVRQIARRLRPVALDELGLKSALVALTTAIARRANLEMHRRFGGALEELSADEELVIYRVAQESLTNVVRHAGARNVSLALDCRDGTPVLEIRDDGSGIPPDRSREGNGIRGMRERALLVGARLDIGSGHREGTCVRLTLPPRGQG